MEITRIRLRKAGPALAVGVAMLAGCQHIPHSKPPAHHKALWEGGDKTTKVSASQMADVQFALGRTLEGRGEFDKAMAAYEEAVKRDSKRGDAYLRMAILLDRQGKFRESATMYDKALAMNPGDPDVYCDKGYSLYLQRRWAESEMSLKQAIVLRPAHPRAHNNLALVLAHDGRDDLALVEFRKGGCTEEDARVNLAFALTLEQKWPEAQKHYRQALALNPASKPAQQGLQDVSRLMAKVAPPATRRDASLATVGYQKPAAPKPAAPAPTAVKPGVITPGPAAPAGSKPTPPRRSGRRPRRRWPPSRRRRSRSTRRRRPRIPRPPPSPRRGSLNPGGRDGDGTGRTAGTGPRREPRTPGARHLRG
jgi:hypothetical protein